MAEPARGRPLTSFDDPAADDSRLDLRGLLEGRPTADEPSAAARPAERTPPARKMAAAGRPAPEAPSEPPTATAPTPASATAPPAAQRAPRRAGRPRRTPEAKPASQSVDGPSRGTTMQVPLSLMDAIVARREQLGLSNGALVITAIEQTLDQLPATIGDRGTAGGSRFARRTVRPATPDTGPSTLLNLRLTDDDFAVLDEIVEETGARSRSHLVSVALRLYLS